MTTYEPHESECYLPTCVARCCLTAKQHQRCRENKEVFYCSAGHGQVFGESVVEQQRKKIAALEQKLEVEHRMVEHFRSRVREERDTWRCPFAGCYAAPRSRGALATHIRAKHVARAVTTLLLPEDAGPDALNMRVDSERVA